MKIKDGYILREVAGQNIVVPVGEAAEQFNGMISLNSTGAFLWTVLMENISRDALIGRLLDEYDVDKCEAEAGVDSFLAKMREAKLIDE